MDDDPWGSAKDPWSTSTDDVILNEDAVPAGPALSRRPTLTITPSLPVPSAASDYVEDDPWSRPSDKTPSPNHVEQPTLSNDITQTADVPPPAKWGLEEPAGFNTWTSTDSVSLPPPEPTGASGLEAQLSPEQIPLPGKDGEDLHIPHPKEAKLKSISEAGWTTSGDEEMQHHVPDLPTLPNIPQPLLAEDETFNPFSQNEGSFDPIPEQPTEGFARSSFDDDAFGGFSTGPNDGYQSGAGLGGSEEGHVGRGWDNQEDDSSMSGIDTPWGMPSDTKHIRNDEEEGFQSSSVIYGQSRIKATSVNDEDGFHSVPSKEREAVSAEKLKQDEWETARREIEMREARAPAEMVHKLVSEWKNVVEQVFPPSGDLDSGKDVEDGLDMETTIRRDRNMARLTELPTGISISFQPLSNTVTWERYQHYVSNMKLDPSTSILAKASAEYSHKINRRKSQEQHDAWQSRSHLGESRELDQYAQQQQSALSPDLDTGRSRWSFWGRKASTPTVPLMTSGGGMLEIKNLDLIPAANAAFDASGPYHVGNQRTPSPSTAQSTSPALSGAYPAKMQPFPQADVTNSEAQPSAVGRFLGKLRRTRPQSPSVDINNKDMDLTPDDFSFLAEVPSLAPKPDPAFGDLLSMNGDGRPSEQLSSLEAMLNHSNPMPLPSKLAPPPRLSVSRGNSSQSSTGAVFPISKSSSMLDLFGDLDLHTTAASSSQPLHSTGMSSYRSPSTTNQPANVAIHRKSQFRPIPPPLPPAQPADHSPLFHPVPLVKATSFEEDGFGDFAASSYAAPSNAAAGALAFDEFGDFENFNTVPAKPNSQRFPPQPSSSNRSVPDLNSSSSNKVSTWPGQSTPSRLDHTPAAQLVSEAARNTRPWPAPPSPSVPALPPPTPSRNMTTFPNISLAPPRSASSSRASTPLNFDFLGGNTSALPSDRLDPSLKSPATNNTIPTATQLSKGQGLTASDISFFDSL